MTFVTVPDKAVNDDFTQLMWAQSIEGNLNAGVTRPLADVLITATSSGIELINIPQTFAHLRLMLLLRSSTPGLTAQTAALRFNSDTGANYDIQQLLARGSTSTPAETLASTMAKIADVPAAAAVALGYAGVSVDIFHYTSPTGVHNGHFTATSVSKVGVTSGAAVYVSMIAGAWRGNDPITRISVLPASDGFVAGSRCSLYGMGAI